MNRLWVRFSLVIACIVICIALFPMAMRRMGLGFYPGKRLPKDRASTGQMAHLQASIEERIWISVSQTLLLGTFFGLTAGVLLSRWLVAPLGQLEQGAQAISERQYSYRVPVTGSQEMMSLAESFNHMAAELEGGEILRRNMLADVAHELRHPVHILQGNLQAFLDGVYPLNLEEIARLSEQTQHLAALVNDLHELALAEAHELPLHKQDTDLDMLVVRSVEIFQPLAANRKITILTRLPEKTIIRNVDSARIQQALQNLVGNAMRCTPAGGEISVTLAEHGSGVEIRVQDTGVGMTSEELPHVFDRFYRADPNRSRETMGTGLGLAIAQAITQAHGGSIEAHSDGENQGSTFTIRLM